MTGGRCRCEGEICTAGADCCNGQCQSGRCALLSECDPVGEACDNSGECCSRACADDGTGFASCQFLGGCRPYGEICRGDADCCNAAVAENVCEPISGSDGLGRCGNPGGCAPAGEICGAGRDPVGTNECCPGMPDGHSSRGTCELLVD